MNKFQQIGRLLANGFTRDQISSVANHAASMQQEAIIRNILQENKKKLELSTRLQDLKYVSLDTETTGFHAEQGDEIISVGAVKIDGISIRDDQIFSRLVQPSRPIPPKITALTGISNQDVATCPSLEYMIKDFLEFIGDRIIVGYYIGHDCRFLNTFLQQRYKRTIPNRVLELKRITELFFPFVDTTLLDKVLQHFGIPVSRRHTADGDALMTAHLWKHLICQCEAEGVDTLGELYHRLSLAS